MFAWFLVNHCTSTNFGFYQKIAEISKIYQILQLSKLSYRVNATWEETQQNKISIKKKFAIMQNISEPEVLFHFYKI